MAYREATAPKSMADKSFKEPPNEPNPVRSPDRKTQSEPAPCVFIDPTPSEVGGIWAQRRCDGRPISQSRSGGWALRPPAARDLDECPPLYRTKFTQPDSFAMTASSPRDV